MSLLFVHSSIDDAGLSPAEFRVLAHLARRGDNDDDTATPGIRSIAKHCGMSCRTVLRAIDVLQERKLIEVEKFRGHKGDQNRYLLTLSSGAPGKRLDGQAVREGNASGAPGKRERCVRETKGNPLRKSNKEIQELPFDSDQFREAWSEWRQHRSEIKKKLTPTSMKRQFKELSEMGEQRAIAAIEHSIKGGWQGIFEPSQKTTPTTKSKTAGLANMKELGT
ncbi:MAG: helix-turn-helix domain-containing protein [Verrucomicrobiales bacterium]